MNSITADLTRVNRALEFISSDDYDRWVKMGMALKSEFGEKGFDSWDRWSQTSDAYDASEAKRHWRSFSLSGKVRIATLFHEAKMHGWRDDGAKPDPAEQEKRRKAARGRAEQEAAKEQEKRESAADTARTLWSEASPEVADNPYMARKSVRPTDTLRQIDAASAARIIGYHPRSKNGALTGKLLVVPVKVSGELSTVELIDGEGRKHFLASGTKAGGYWAAQAMPDVIDVLLIGEGVSTVLSARQATGYAVVAAMDCGNLERVAKAMRERYPAAKIIVLADLGNGSNHAAQAGGAIGAIVAKPDFGSASADGLNDFNDMANVCGLDAVREAIEQASKPVNPDAPPPFTGVSAAQLSAARLAPKCFVENYLFADVALLAAAGGTGKTTMALYEAVCLALGWPIWGNRVIHTGKTLFITAEDSAEQFHARLREIMAAMELTESAKRHVMDGIMVWDITGQTRRLAELGDNQNIVVTDLADQIIEVYRDAGLAQVVIDPLVSFGPGERFINDGNQAVIVAARRIVRGLGCCVRLVHHVDQGSARGGALDQYAARGGTALPDGCRMVAILGSVKDEAGLSRCPPECEPGPNDSVFILARPKLSYAPPQPQIWIVRRGYSFQHFVAVKRSPGEEMEADATKVEAFLCTELKAGRCYTVRQMEDTRATSLPRKRLRAAIGLLETTGRIRHEQLDKGKQRGARKEYLHPTSYCATPPGAIDEKSAPEPNQSEPIAPATSIAPPLRENINGAIDAVSISPVSPIAPLNDGAIAAQWRNSHETAISDDEMEVF